MGDTEEVKIAAVLCPRGVDADALLAGIAAELAAEGYHIAGLTQRPVAPAEGARAVLHVEDLASGQLVRITQDLGREATGCRLDPEAMAGLAGALLGRLDGPTDAVILNRFGKAEGEGQGLRAVAERACGLGIPVLVGLRPGHRDAWDAFTGGDAALLPPDPAAVLAWLRAAIAGASEMAPDSP